MSARHLLWGLMALLLISQHERTEAREARLKELVNIRGIRSNQLSGYGIVFGLSKTGDSQASRTTRQAVAQMMNRMGLMVTADQLVTGNFASVIATAELPPFAQGGDRIDIRLSANGDASSLAGGTLLLTPLRGGDGEVYAVAQGPVITSPADGTGPQVLTVARLPGGATVEKEFRPEIAPGHKISLSLKNQDNTTNIHVTEAINKHFRGFYAHSTDPGSIEVKIPPPFHNQIVSFLSELENLKVQVDQRAVVVLNERTGTVVMGHGVRIGAVTISHGNLSLKINKPGLRSAEEHHVVPVGGVTVGDLIQSLNALGVRPQDLIGILQAIKAAGALHGELISI
ncbi:MAG: flagellar basal body P-ring protein FlgI [Deltaproteobacteria bacterium]|nr:flagellar basal body P-ring protein FlgI [Deltaproteobacteria bacterium]